jgi:hypothetical protein
MRPEEDDSFGREFGGDAVHNLVDGSLGGHLIVMIARWSTEVRLPHQRRRFPRELQDSRGEDSQQQGAARRQDQAKTRELMQGRK